MRALLGLVLALLWSVAALAQERITDFDVDIVVEPSGDLLIEETIRVVSEGQQIRRGIFRELPARYTFLGVSQPYEYELLGVSRDGAPKGVSTLREGNAVTWRLGRADVLLDPGPHEYRIRYRVGDQIRRHEDGNPREELYWNVTGTYSPFPILSARATVRFPNGARIVDAAAYTGRRGSSASDAQVRIAGPTVSIETTRPLPSRAGLTVSVSAAPGAVAPLTAEQRSRFFWLKHGAVILLGLGGLAMLLFYWRTWDRVGRDPVKPPVFPRYEPPKQSDGEPYSPAAVHYIHHKGFRDMDALSSLMMQMGAQGTLDIEADKARTTIRQVSGAAQGRDASALLDAVMPSSGVLELDGGTDTKFYSGVMDFHRTLTERYGPKYYKRNLLWAMLGIAASIVLAVVVLVSPVAKNSPVVLGLFAGLALLNIVFAFLLPAPTKRGAQISSEIDGFELYLKTAEEKRLNMADPVAMSQGGRAPAMTVELYERFLPYAMALGVEKPWTRQFETSLPREAADYRPAYVRGNAFRPGRGPIDFGRTLNKTLSTGVAAAAPVSQSSGSGGFSSGSGGGGFSGGGGGGGGVGGW